MNRPGFYKGRHFSSYVGEVKVLIREGQFREAETLLLALVDCTEIDSACAGYGVAPWYYEALARLYRKLKLPQKEIEILQRFSQQKHGIGGVPGTLIERLKKKNLKKIKPK